MIDRDRKNGVLRSMEVDMSSEAIAQRIRDASELNALGLSLAKAKPCSSPYGSPKTASPPEASPLHRNEPTAEK